jgi:hypothetical protein
VSDHLWQTALNSALDALVWDVSKLVVITMLVSLRSNWILGRAVKHESGRNPRMVEHDIRPIYVELCVEGNQLGESWMQYLSSKHKQRKVFEMNE